MGHRSLTLETQYMSSARLIDTATVKQHKEMLRHVIVIKYQHIQPTSVCRQYGWPVETF